MRTVVFCFILFRLLSVSFAGFVVNLGVDFWHHFVNLGVHFDVILMSFWVP
jgi:hypothetical protein